MRKKIKMITIFFCAFILTFTMTSCLQKIHNNQIIYKDKVLTIGSTKEEINNLLGEGILIDEHQSQKNNTINIYVYQYDDIKVTYYSEIGGDLLTSGSFSWSSEKVETFNNIIIGSNKEYVKKKYPSETYTTGNITTLKFINDKETWGYSTPNPTENGIITSIYTYTYDDHNDIYDIYMYLPNYEVFWIKRNYNEKRGFEWLKN